MICLLDAHIASMAANQFKSMQQRYVWLSAEEWIVTDPDGQPSAKGRR